MTSRGDLQLDILSQAATQARGLAIDAVHKAGIGHLGLPLGCAEMGAVLYGHALQHHPAHPRWINRDRFVLSAGHGSMFLYAWLHLSGYDISLDEVRNFRQLHSITPGHPEFQETPGVECTTGPLGQGVGNAVGMAIALEMSAARYNSAEHPIFDSHVICLAGDGCLQEGVARESVALAGHLGLDRLILIYDDNAVTLDAQAEESQSEDTAGIYRALGWDTVTIDGHDMALFEATLQSAKLNHNGRPKLIIAKTLVGKGIPEVAGTWKAHGEGGAKFADSARAGLGLPAGQHFYISPEVTAYFAEHRRRLDAAYAAWEKRYQAWKAAHPDLAKELEAAVHPEPAPVDKLFAAVPAFQPDEKLATRVASGKALQHLAKEIPLLVTGSADLFGSTRNYLDGQGDFTRANRKGRNFRFGIREHAMGAICNGLAYDGIWLPSGATFLTFSDYMRPALRLAALSKLRVFHFFTHDSVGVGEDGPTHQPVETTSALRLIPFLTVVRPADPEETVGALVLACTNQDGPTALILTRQNVPMLNSIPADQRRRGVLRGGYIARREEGPLETIIMATGSEVQHALAAAQDLGPGVRVVSMPCLSLFELQDQAYRDEVLPKSCRRRVAIEAGVGHLWWKWVGLDGAVVAIDRFGLSAPGAQVLTELGMSKDHVVEAVRRLG